jgi:simple sugar transport system substrate-binding protein
MRRLLGILLALAAVAIVAACGTPDKSASTKTSTGADANATTTKGGSDSVQLTQRRGLTIAMVTHGDGGSFWAVAKKGAQDAAKDMGVTLRYSESNNDPERQAQMIEAAVTQKVDGIAVSAPNPDAIKGALQRAKQANIPIITLNSGAEESASLGAFTHVGQTEEIAGEGAGKQLKQAGVKKVLCVIHEQANIGLNQRCDGAKKGFGGTVTNLQVKGTDDIQTTLTEIQSKLSSDKSFDGVLALNPDIAIAARDAAKAASSDAKVATFDLSGDVVKSIQDGSILFAVDQQQYLQGYLPVVFLTLNKTNANTVGGGEPVLTGPGFVTKDNAATIQKLAEAGTR